MLEGTIQFVAVKCNQNFRPVAQEPPPPRARAPLRRREMRRAGWLPDDVASVDEEVDAGHEGRGAAEQEDDGTYHVLRLGVPA
jgi:hypothetical protein